MASRSFVADDPANRTCTFGYVQAQLGQNALSQRRMLEYLRALIADHGFPAPLPTIIKGGKLTKDPHPSSKWLRTAVHAWLDGYIPPDCAATIDDQAFAAAALDMDAAATNLRLVAGKDFKRRDHAARNVA